MYIVEKRNSRNGSWRRANAFLSLKHAKAWCLNNDNLHDGRIIDSKDNSVVWDDIIPIKTQAVSDMSGEVVGRQAK